MPWPAPTPPVSPRNGMPWRSTASRLIRSAAVFCDGHLAHVGRLLVRVHRPTADDALRLADHEPGEVVAVHAPPRAREQVVGQLEPRLERGQRRRRREALALGDQLAGAQDELVAGHAPSLGRVPGPGGRLGPMPAPTPHDIAWFDSPEELRDWLEANRETATERWIGMRPKAAGLPTVTWEQIVDEVLCVGWIDGVRYRTEGGSCIRITPRRAGSVWSARNIGRVEALRRRAGCGPGRGRVRAPTRGPERDLRLRAGRHARRRGGRGAPRGGRPRVLRGPVEELPAARGRLGRRREAARDAGQAARRGRGGQRRRTPGGRAQPQPAPRGLIAGVRAGSTP